MIAVTEEQRHPADNTVPVTVRRNVTQRLHLVRQRRHGNDRPVDDGEIHPLRHGDTPGKSRQIFRRPVAVGKLDGHGEHHVLGIGGRLRQLRVVLRHAGMFEQDIVDHHLHALFLEKMNHVRMHGPLPGPLAVDIGAGVIDVDHDDVGMGWEGTAQKKPGVQSLEFPRLEQVAEDQGEYNCKQSPTGSQYQVTLHSPRLDNSLVCLPEGKTPPEPKSALIVNGYEPESSKK